MFDSKTTKKIRSTNEKLIDRDSELRLQLQMDTRDLSGVLCRSKESKSSPPHPQKENTQKKNDQQNMPGQLEIVLWNRDRSRRIVDFRHSSDGPALRRPQETGNGPRKVGEVRIRIFECPLKKRNFEFSFLTNQSSQVKSVEDGFGSSFSWTGLGDASQFDLGLMKQGTCKKSERASTQGGLKTSGGHFFRKIILEAINWKRNGFVESASSVGTDAREPPDSNGPEGNWCGEGPDEDIQIFTNLYKFLYKLFMGVPFMPLDMHLKDVEREIVSYILKKKKFVGAERVEFTPDFFNRARQTPLRKKNEDGLKFVFKKAIKHLKSEFKREQGLHGTTLTIDQFDRRFYGHYFAEVAKREGVSLLCFYHFRNWKKRTSSLIPKSITRRYLKLLKKNPEFIGSVLEYLHHRFSREFQCFNSNKIRHLIIKWEGILQEHPDSASGLRTIRALILKKGSKLPWTRSEVNFAYQKTLDSIHRA